MRDLEECKAEILRLSEKKKAEKRRLRARILTVCVSVCLVAVIASSLLISGVMRSGRKPSVTGTDAVGTEAADTTVPGDVTSGAETEPTETVPSATEPPVTEPPETEPSVTEPPETEPPETEPPETNAPETNVPVTDAPPTDEPSLPSAVNLMLGITPQNVNDSPYTDAQNVAYMKFAIDLFKSAYSEGENNLVSPLSVLTALSMTANGADGETLRQMEDAFGMTVDELNHYIYSYMKLVSGRTSETSGSVVLANSLWFNKNSGRLPNRDFLQTNADFYGASVYSLPFDRNPEVDINCWVNEKTNGMIDSVLEKDDLAPNALLCLVNALTFRAQWETIYYTHKVRSGTFTNSDSTSSDVELMYSDEYYYLEDSDTVGFMKPYEGSDYAFAALLPKDGKSVAEYMSTLTADSVIKLLSGVRKTEVAAFLPKFTASYSADLCDTLSKMGVRDAFDPNFADFSRFFSDGAGESYIGSLIHKTFISVGEKGTEAGAVTVVVDEPDSYPNIEVILNRPFVYMIIDCTTNTPLFIGTAENLSAGE